MYTHTYIRSAIRMNDTILSMRTARAQHSTRTVPPVTYATAATNTNTCFAPILPSLRQTMYRLLYHVAHNCY